MLHKFKKKGVVMKVTQAKVNVPKVHKSKNVVTVTSDVSLLDVLKSVRVFENSKGDCSLDYRLKQEYRSNGKDRIRFSTGKPFTKRNIQQIERDKFSLALNHFLENNELNDGNVYFKDIAWEAIQEESDNRMADIQQDYESIYNNSIKDTFDGMLLEDIKVSDLKQWKKKLLTDHPMSLSRYKKYHRVMNMIFKYAYINEFLNKNLMDLVDRKSKLFVTKIKPEHAYYSSKEVKAILGASEGWFKAYLTTLLYSGMRPGESLALQFSDLDFDNHKITLQRSIRHGKLRNSTKTGTINVIDMPEPVKQELLALQRTSKSQKWVFPNPNSLKPFYQPKAIIDAYFKPLLKELDIEYRTLYATRHSFASNMVELGVPLTYIQKQLTHKKLSTTMDYYIKYSNVNENKRDERVDRLFA